MASLWEAQGVRGGAEGVPGRSIGSSWASLGGARGPQVRPGGSLGVPGESLGSQGWYLIT